MASSYAAAIAALAPDHDPAHIEAWMRLEHATLDGLDAAHFAAEVQAAIACVQLAGIAQSDELAHSYGLQVTYHVGDHVLVSQEGGLAAAAAQITGENEHRPHLVRIKYDAPRRAGGWIARTRIVSRVASPSSSTSTATG
jgi:hypothetical protein